MAKKSKTKIDDQFKKWCDVQKGCISLGSKPCDQCEKAFLAGRKVGYNTGYEDGWDNRPKINYETL